MLARLLKSSPLIEQAAVSGLNVLLILSASVFLVGRDLSVFIALWSLMALINAFLVNVISWPFKVWAASSNERINYWRRLEFVFASGIICAAVLAAAVALVANTFENIALDLPECFAIVALSMAWLLFDLLRRASLVESLHTDTSRAIFLVSIFLLSSLSFFRFSVGVSLSVFMLTIALAYMLVASVLYLHLSAKVGKDSGAGSIGRCSVLIEHVRYGFPMVPSMFLFWLGTQAYFLLLSSDVPDDELGLLRSALALSGGVSAVGLALENKRIIECARALKSTHLHEFNLVVRASNFRSVCLLSFAVIGSALLGGGILMAINSWPVGAALSVVFVFSFAQGLFSLVKLDTSPIKAMRRTILLPILYAPSVVSLSLILLLVKGGVLDGWTGIQLGYFVTAVVSLYMSKRILSHVMAGLR